MHRRPFDGRHLGSVRNTLVYKMEEFLEQYSLRFSLMSLKRISHVSVIPCRFYRKDSGEWDAHRVISIPPKKVSGWTLEDMPGERALMVFKSGLENQN